MKEKDYFWIYIIECNNGNYYTGYTDNLVRRYWQHKNGSGKAKYTRSFKPVRIAQSWKLFASKGTALKIEYLIKTKKRKIKDKIVDEPELLSKIIYEDLKLNLKIYPFDPRRVEAQSLKFTKEDLKNDIDPFQDDAI